MRSPAKSRTDANESPSDTPQAVPLPASIYQELRKIARHFMQRESSGHTLQPTALVHEAFLRLASHEDLAGCGPTRTRAMFGQAMHHILVDHARRRQTRKRGGERIRVCLDDQFLAAPTEEDLLDLDEVLRKLKQIDPRQAELVELRIFSGMTVEEAAGAQGVSKRTAEREWTAARAWLRRELASLAPHDS